MILASENSQGGKRQRNTEKVVTQGGMLCKLHDHQQRHGCGTKKRVEKQASAIKKLNPPGGKNIERGKMKKSTSYKCPRVTRSKETSS